jgi:hypothetical protein
MFRLYTGTVTPLSHGLSSQESDYFVRSGIISLQGGTVVITVVSSLYTARGREKKVCYMLSVIINEANIITVLKIKLD